MTRPNADVEAGMEAIVRGVLGYDETERCLFLETAGVRYPVVWPTGTTAHRDPIEVVLPDGTPVNLGDEVAGSGGYLRAAELEGIDGTDVKVPAACLPETGELAVFNHRSDIDVLSGSASP